MDEDIETDMLPPVGRTVREMFSGQDSNGSEPKSKTTTKTRTRSAPSGPDWDEIEEDLRSFYEFFGMMFTPIAPNGAQALQGNAEKAASAWVNAGQHNKRIERFLTGSSSLTVYAALAMAHMPIGFAFYHDLVVVPRLQMQEAQKAAQETPGFVTPNGESVG